MYNPESNAPSHLSHLVYQLPQGHFGDNREDIV